MNAVYIFILFYDEYKRKLLFVLYQIMSIETQPQIAVSGIEWRDGDAKTWRPGLPPNGREVPPYVKVRCLELKEEKQIVQEGINKVRESISQLIKMNKNVENDEMIPIRKNLYKLKKHFDNELDEFMFKLESIKKERRSKFCDERGW